MPSSDDAILVHDDHTSFGGTFLLLSSETFRELVALLDARLPFSRDRLRLTLGDGPASVKRGVSVDEPDAVPNVLFNNSSSSSMYEMRRVFLGRSVLVVGVRLAFGIVIFAGEASG